MLHYITNNHRIMCSIGLWYKPCNIYLSTHILPLNPRLIVVPWFNLLSSSVVPSGTSQQPQLESQPPPVCQSVSWSVPRMPLFSATFPKMLLLLLQLLLCCNHNLHTGLRWWLLVPWWWFRWKVQGGRRSRGGDTDRALGESSWSGWTREQCR